MVNSFLIKRDDLTGCELSGNKVRKLEYLLAEAKQKRADIIFTSGGDQSNHARATVIAARKIGLKTKLFLWGQETPNANGNHFLDKVFGADIQYFTKSGYEKVNDVMFEQRLTLAKKEKECLCFSCRGINNFGNMGLHKFY